MDGGEPVKSKPELSDSWMVINDSAIEQENHGGPSDGSDGESVEVIDQEEYEKALVEETDYYSIPPEEEITGPKIKKYVHHPNNDVNAALNKLMIIAATVVVGLAVGHYLGYSEEVTDLTTVLKKLESENTILKNHVCKLFENYVDHNTNSLHTKFREPSIDTTLYHIIALNIKCPVLETLKANLQADLYEIMQTHAKGHLTEDKLRERIEKLLQNRAYSDDAISGKSFSKLSESEGEHDNLSDQINQAPAKENLSADKLQDIIGKSLQNRMNDQSFSKIPQFEGEHSLLSDELLDDTASEAETGQYSTKSNFNSETSNLQEPEESVYSFKSHEKLPADNSLEKLSKNVPIKTDEAVETAASQKSAGSNVLTESTLHLKGTEECPSNGDLQSCFSKLQPPTENVLKHIVKDMVHEMTESLLLSHHNNILKDIRDETKVLLQSVPLFKSALLLNMEVISKLKSHVNYVKHTFQSFLDYSHGSIQQEKLANILNDVSKHTQTLEKAMHTLQLLETALDQKKEFALKSQQDKACAGAEFFEKFYINNSAITVPFTDEKTMSYSDNVQKLNSMASKSNSENDLDVTSITESLHMSRSEKKSGEMVHETGTVKLEDTNAIHHGGDTPQELPNKLMEKVPQGYHVHNGNSVTDKYTGTKKHTEPTQSNENESHSTKYSNNKHNAKYQDSKKIKRNKKEHKKGNRKENKKENKEKFNKHEKKLKRDSRDIKKKHVHHSNVWVEEEGEQKHSNVSGEWVINLHRGRAESRDAEHQSDWLFDRASARNAKRKGKWDMRNWYFERAESRNYCRQKPNCEKNNCPSDNKEKQFHGKDKKRFSKFRKYFKPKYWISKAYMAISKF